MAYALIANTSKSNGNPTSAINTTGANLIVIGVGTDTGDLANPTDSKSNTWTKLTTSTGDTDTIMTLYYAFNPTVGSGHTFDSGHTYNSIFVAAFSGAASLPLDQQNGNSLVVNATSLSTGSVTPTQDNELIIAVWNVDGTNSLHSINGGFTQTNEENGINGVSYGGMMGYLIQTTATAANPTGSWTGSVTAAARIATFKAAAVLGATFNNRMLMGVGQ